VSLDDGGRAGSRAAARAIDDAEHAGAAVVAVEVVDGQFDDPTARVSALPRLRTPASSISRPDDNEGGGTMKVKELMTENVLAVGPEAPLKDVAAILAEYRISGLPVISEQRRVLGVVSEADILVKERGPEARHEGLIGWLLAGGLPDDERLSARISREAMTSPATTIGAERHVSSARLMTENESSGSWSTPTTSWSGSSPVRPGQGVRARTRRSSADREDAVQRALWIGEG
jgi:nucleotide-binding universal stress UspA family protein